MTMMHHFLPATSVPPTQALTLRRPYLWKVMPSSIVPYMVTLPVPDAEPEPPCAQALSITIDATTAKTVFITAFPQRQASILAWRGKRLHGQGLASGRPGVRAHRQKCGRLATAFS